MGADGHIRLMEWDGFANSVASEEICAWLLENLKDSQTYLQSFYDKKVLTVYWGDNLYSVSLLEELVSHGAEKGHWHDSFYFDAFDKVVNESPYNWEEVLKWCHLLWNDFRIDEWEVWT